MMKKILMLSLVLSAIWINGFAQQEGKEYDNEEGSSMVPIIYELDTLVGIIEHEFKAEIVRMEFDILRDTAYSVRMLFPGYKYGIFTYGDYRIKEIDLSIYQQIEGKWVFVSNGNIDKNTCLGWVEPKEPGLYTFKIFPKEYYGNYNGGHYGILIFH